MMVTFVSECEKKSLNKTRRVLDAFANRIGSRTWQTVITNEGLLAVKKLLKKTASKNTAVACHWLRSRSRSELVWMVGNRERFNGEGVVPVNSTQKNIVNTQWENDWQYLPIIKALTALSALFHDWGKASKLFQEKLNPKSKNKYKGDPLRHEWISCVLLHALVYSSENKESDVNWLTQLSEGNINEVTLKEFAEKKELKPLSKLPATASLIAWLIISHHRIPNFSTNISKTRSNYLGESASHYTSIFHQIRQNWGYKNHYDEKEYKQRINDCFDFQNGLISDSKKWLRQVKRWAKKLLDCQSLIEKSLTDGTWRLILHHSRLCLMLGDHHYSSKEADKNWQNVVDLYANTDRVTKQFKQKLDEHLVGVAKYALKTTQLLPAFENSPPKAMDIQSLKKASPKKFKWQDKAVAQIKKYKTDSNKKRQGFFAVNMASTGCGKTYANAKVMQALSDDGESLRYVLALGLRMLTLQTGDEYRDRIGLNNDELAILIGSKAVMDLHKQAINTDDGTGFEQAGSESEEFLIDEEIDYDCDIPEEGLATVLTQEKDRKFLYSPVLVCTIDHLMAATETKRGGKYILPCLRLMSSDLVIDEIDDFTGSDLIAIGRLIHLAGMLGRKVMISSATIPPDLAEGYFNAYREGWQLFSKSREACSSIACVWIDEYKTQLDICHHQQSGESTSFYNNKHIQFINKRIANLIKKPAKQRANIHYCQNVIDDYEYDSNETKQTQYFAEIQKAIIEKHQKHHFQDEVTQKEVSFGVVRVANIPPCIALTEYLMQSEWGDEIDVRVMSYHSQQVLILRHEQEKHLDEVLKRKEKSDEMPIALKNKVIRQHLDNGSKKHLIFILVATPVEEVGRDHDFDWAVVEPSSYRSIIQLAGRVRRHRESTITEPNIALMQYNLKAIQEKQYPYSRPGYEANNYELKTHNLDSLIDESAILEAVTAIPRIQKSEKLQPNDKLADLEHEVTSKLLTSYTSKGAESLQGYLTQHWWLTALPQILNPFRKSEPTTKLFLMLDEGETIFIEKDKKGFPVKREGILSIERKAINTEIRSKLWLERDYQSIIEKMADDESSSEKITSLRYGEISITMRDNTDYEYSDQFGLRAV
ncbi:MAG: type I-F CRISPR-associated helicase Cas3 [Methylococcales bacterium]|jgi:CRISPR-associated endonuclease/helicase Cas3|nr:type I-F CRISPR-associated helicase Cas3 [Methylococcales bacterium]MBT7411397.1 type I-F CRISPR-associated helicase Cas3 [Methylococcales bacterium]